MLGLKARTTTPGLIIYFMCMGILLVCLSVYYVCAWCQWMLEEEVGFPATGVTGGCDRHMDAGNLGPLQKQQALLILSLGHLFSPSFRLFNFQ